MQPLPNDFFPYASVAGLQSRISFAESEMVSRISGWLFSFCGGIHGAPSVPGIPEFRLEPQITRVNTHHIVYSKRYARITTAKSCYCRTAAAGQVVLKSCNFTSGKEIPDVCQLQNIALGQVHFWS